MKSIIKCIVLLILKIFPLRREVVFRSFNGRYSDSPKAISERLHELRPDIKQVWLVDEKTKGSLPGYAKEVEIDSITAIFHSATAAAFIDNNYGRKGINIIASNNKVFLSKLTVWLNTTKGQINLSTWHGTPLKKIGKDQPGSQDIDFLTPPLIMVHPNKHTQNVMERITFQKISSELMGLPRNDLLFSQGKNNEIRRKLGFSEEQRIVLYAPTFRSDGYDTDSKNVERSGLLQLKEMQFDKLFKALEHKFGGEEWVFVGRFHYFVDNEIDWDALTKADNRIVNGNEHEDINEYLLVSDVLITDCSSCLFDFALTKKPAFLFFPDLENYKNSERGFYFEVNKMPFPCTTTFNELISKIDLFDTENYSEYLEKMNCEMMNADEGHASQRVVEYIFNNSRTLA